MSWTAANCAQKALSKRRKAFGALDLGTNNCRLMIVVRRPGGFSVVDSFSRIVRLGDGLARHQQLSDEAQDRAIGALKRCAEIIARWQLAGLRCVTTQACRQATNGAAFVERVRLETGLRLDIIDPVEEASLAVLSCSDLINQSPGPAMVFDIGGGSTEISVATKADRTARASASAPVLRQMISLPMGVVSLSDTVAANGFTGQHFQDIRFQVADDIGSKLEATSFAQDGGHLIGTSGTATSLAALSKGLKRYRRREIDGCWLDVDEVDRIIEHLFELGQAGRGAQPCIGRGRADLIMPGCAILRGILDATRSRRIRVADRGLREGLIAQLLSQPAAHPAAGNLPDVSLAE